MYQVCRNDFGSGRALAAYYIFVNDWEKDHKLKGDVPPLPPTPQGAAAQYVKYNLKYGLLIWDWSMYSHIFIILLASDIIFLTR